MDGLLREGGPMPSLRDVAAVANVSPMTVSNVLNGRQSVNPEIRERVEEALRETGYVRNEAARALRAGRTHVVGVMALEAVNPFYGELVAGVEDGMAGEDVLVVSAASHADLEREVYALRRFAELRVKGVVVTASRYLDPLRSAIANLIESGVNVVLVAHPRDGFDRCTVSGDDVLGGLLAGEHLAALPVERFGYVGGPAFSQVHGRRKVSYLDVLARAGRTVTFTRDCPGDSMTDGAMAGRDLIAGDDRPQAVFCSNDMLALGVLQAATEAGLRVPEDLAVLGYDDVPFAAGAAVPLSSVGQDIRRMGREAARLLRAEAAQGTEHRHESVVLEPKVRARASTCLPAR
jgi:LacI family transcriptional regulator